MTLAEVCREQRRLAYQAPANCACLNMHLYWLGVAADLWRSGDASLEWLLREAAAGEIFAAGHAESGNDVPVLLSTTKAERVDGGYQFTGRKHFGSLTPVWTRFGLHGMDTSNPSQPKIIHAFMPRDTAGYTIKETWECWACAPRAAMTPSWRTCSFQIATSPGWFPPRSGGRSVVLAVFAWALMGFGNIYYGLARALSTKASPP